MFASLVTITGGRTLDFGDFYIFWCFVFFLLLLKLPHRGGKKKKKKRC